MPQMLPYMASPGVGLSALIEVGAEVKTGMQWCMYISTVCVQYFVCIVFVCIVFVCIGTYVRTHCFLYGFMYGGEMLCGKSDLIGWHTHLSQAMMEKLSLEVEKNLKLKSQLEETGDSKKVCTFSHAPICRWCHAVYTQSSPLPPAGTSWCSDRGIHLEVHCQRP